MKSFLDISYRAVHRDRTVRYRRSRQTVAVPVPLRLSSTNQTDGGRDGQHPSNAVKKRPSTALDGMDGSFQTGASHPNSSELPERVLHCGSKSSALCRTSKQFHHIAIRLLYRTVLLTRPAQAVQFSRAILVQPLAALAVHPLHVGPSIWSIWS
jgi:hypothetical protein